MVLLEQKREKCIELMRNSTAIHEVIQKYKAENEGGQPLDLNSLIQHLFQDRHFTNSKYIIHLNLTSISYSVNSLITKKARHK